MPTKRRTPKNHEHPITAEAIDAFRKGDHVRLHRALGLKPWQHSPLDVDRVERPAWINPVDWNLQTELRAELIEAAGGASCR